MKKLATRQKVRLTIITISFLLFPITLFYLSPYLPIQGAAECLLSGSMIVFIAMFVSSLFIGRAFCGWFCPGAGIQSIFARIVTKRARGGKWDWIKYLIWLPWIGLIIFIGIQSGGFTRIDMLFHTTYGISVANPGAYIIYYGVLILIVLLAMLTGKRGFCHYSCWMAPFMIIGRKIRNLIGWHSLQLKAEQEKCIHCRLCTNSCPMSLDVEEMVNRGDIEDTECILCGSCVDACPKGVIHFSFGIRKKRPISKPKME
jgi:polyferredoxin